MKTIIISDLHNRVDWVEIALSSPVLKPYNRVIFLGDYFDDYHDTTRIATNSAEWLKQSLYEPNRIHLVGTHDLWYRFPNNRFIPASGNSWEKAYAIRSVLTDEDWNLLKLFHYEQNFLMTHAGVSSHLINSYVAQREYIYSKYTHIVHNEKVLDLNTQEVIDKIIKPATDEALIDISNNKSNPWLDAGYARGGRQPVGGIIWLDWNAEFEPVPGLNQIVGHTEMKVPTQKITDDSINYCLDTRNHHIGILEDGKFSYVLTIDVLEAFNQ